MSNALIKPPFRADQVGSLLRPPALAAARAKLKQGQIDAAALRAAEDDAILAALAKQQAIGMQAVTDGEFRRDYWHLDFLAQLDGVTLKANPGPRFGGTEEQPPIATITGKVACTRPIMVDHFTFLRDATRFTPKFTLPSPAMLHLRGGRNAIARDVYPELEEFWVDAARAYRAAIGHLADAGCRYLQIDDITFSYLCDQKVRENCRANGDDPDTLPQAYVSMINGALRGRPPDMVVTMHTCRGNFKSAWVAQGGYEPIAETMFQADIDAFFMEFDSERAGGFEPLRYLPKGKKAVLGLVTTKVGALEDKDVIKRRIEAAAKFVPLDNLCLSPQCGFASTHHGNALSHDDQWRKLERVIEVAREVWG